MFNWYRYYYPKDPYIKQINKEAKMPELIDKQRQLVLIFIAGVIIGIMVSLWITF